MAIPDHWNPERYQKHANFVSDLGSDILSKLAASKHEIILDVGCGDGVLTRKIMQQSHRVIGTDASASMVEAANKIGVKALLLSMQDLNFENEFDAVFSNAAMHWVLEQSLALKNIHRSLKHHGRFVAEFGAKENVKTICDGIAYTLAQHGFEYKLPWYFPNQDEYNALLESNGFRVDYIHIFDRPTPLPTGLKDWLVTFSATFFEHIPSNIHADLLDQVCKYCQPHLMDEQGTWFADYQRIQVHATKHDLKS